MKILEVDIENFKNHEKQVFRFAEGINAISGPNGAGKTSIIEAISWVLFDNKPYNIEGIVTRSSSPKVATVKVRFLSDLDKKEYTVCRNSRGSYYVVESETLTRIAEKAADVKYFLKKHYNLSDSTELNYMFTNTIGVPQGTFTSIFLDSATNRKKVFDKVLNLEDYRESYDYLNNVNSFIKTLLTESEIKIASYKPFVDKKPDLMISLNNLDLEYKQLNSKISNHEESLNQLELNNKKLDDLLSIITDYQTKITHTELSLSHIKEKIERENIDYRLSLKAKDVVNKLKPIYDKYLDIKVALEKEEQRKKEYENLEKEVLKADKDLQGVIFKISSNEESLLKLEEIKNEIMKLEPSKLFQEELEKDKEALTLKQEEMRKNENDISASQKELKEISDNLSFIEKALTEYDKIKDNVENFNAKSKSYQEEMERKLELETSLTESKKMAGIIKTGQCPFLNEDCKNISEGQNLQEFFISRIDSFERDIEIKNLTIIELKKDIDKMEKDIDNLRRLDFQKEEREKLLEKVRQKRVDVENIEKLQEAFRGLPEEIVRIKEELRKLGSPRDRIQALRDQIRDEESIKRSLVLAQKNKEVLGNRQDSLKIAIEQLNFSSSNYQNLRKELLELEKEYQEYIINENKSKNLDKIKLEIDHLEKESLKITEAKSKTEKELVQVQQDYNRDIHNTVKRDLDLTKAELLKAIENKKYNEKETVRIKKELDEILEKSILAEHETTTIEKVKTIQSFLDTSRDVLKRCSPMIGKFYIENISNEANLLYKEIMQKDNQELIWKLDYEITVEENGLSRPFQNLSGGEQMAAAISVRLALLRELSDINIAFFDEPTTNMDEIRRNNLAEQIKNISSFDQIFIISHDDTFEKDIDNVIRLN